MKRLLPICLLMLELCSSVYAADWQPADGPLMTRWAEDVGPDNVWPEYPRPQMVRETWVNLNGLWDYAIQAKDAGHPKFWDGQIGRASCRERV